MCAVVKDEFVKPEVLHYIRRDSNISSGLREAEWRQAMSADEVKKVEREEGEDRRGNTRKREVGDEREGIFFFSTVCRKVAKKIVNSVKLVGENM